MRRTIVDWLAHAAAAENQEAFEGCIASATAQTESFYHWRTLLGGVSELARTSPELLVRIATSTLEAAAEEREIWGFRDVAKIRATRLDDLAGARAALEACISVFTEPRPTRYGMLLDQAPSTKGYEWVLLAEAFVETLGDEDGLRRCLELGRDSARARGSFDDLCSIAVHWASALDRADGLELLREAEVLANIGNTETLGDDDDEPDDDEPDDERADTHARKMWTLANAWHGLGDTAAAKRVLDTALTDATTVSSAVTIASAWSSHRNTDKARLALQRAQGLASTAAHWLEIGETAFDSGQGEASVRLALQRAEFLARHTEDRARISAGYCHWLNDEGAAARLGPRGISPELFRVMVAPLPDWEASAAGLFDWLRGQITPEELLRIANADYGMGAAKHLAALTDICSTGLVPKELAWEPHEVLALTRWSSGEGVHHLERALCCVLLCFSPDSMDEFLTNAPILADSCLALGPAAIEHAERFFAWYAQTVDAVELEDFDELDDEGPERTIAGLLLFVLRVRSAADDPRLTTLADRLTRPPSWSLKPLAESMATSMRPKLWAALLKDSLDAAHPVSARLLRALAGDDSD